MRKNKEVAEMGKKVVQKLKEEVQKKGLNLSFNENGTEGKSKMIASCGFLEDELRQCSKDEGVTMADSVETLGVDLRTGVKKLGVKEKARRKKCKVRFSLIKKRKTFQKRYMKVGVKNDASCGNGASKDVESACGRYGSYGKIEIEEANGSGSGQKKYNLVVPVHGSIWS